MNYACLTLDSHWASFHNQANLPNRKSISASVGYEDRFGMNELSTRSASLIIPAGKAAIGGIYTNFGNSDYKRHSAGLACGIRLSDHLSAGVQADYFSELTYGDYKDHEFVTFEAGILLSLGNVKAGVHVFNPVKQSRSGFMAASVIRAGAGIKLDNSAYASAETELSTLNTQLIRIGFEYEAFKKVFLRGGFCTENTSFSMGIGYNPGYVRFDLGFVTHDKLGITPSASLIFSLN